jgi:hypothetical protein
LFFPSEPGYVRATISQKREIGKGLEMRKVTLSLLVLVLGVPAVAQAQDPAMPMPTAEASPAPAAPALGKDNWPLSFVDRPLGLSAGMAEVDLILSSSLSKGAVGKPVNIPLIAFFGVTDEFQLALSHGTGVCLGDKATCPKVYNDVRLTGLYSILGRGSNFELAGWVAANFASFDPLRLSAVIGPAINWVIAGNAALLAYPGLIVGVTERDTGNKEGLEAPVYLYVRAGEKLAPYLITGLAATPFDGFGDNYAIPVGVGAIYGINTMFDVGAAFQFNRLVAGAAGGVDSRSLFAYLNVRPL